MADVLPTLTPLHLERPKFYGVLTVLSAIGLSYMGTLSHFSSFTKGNKSVNSCLLPKLVKLLLDGA